MDPTMKKKVLVLVTLFIGIIQSLDANIGEYDEHWKQQADGAHKAAQESYNYDPFQVTNELNHNAHQVSIDSNDTRRNLAGTAGGPCEATNPIDSCWRCDPKWDTNRKKLANCALGFGAKTTGGKDGPIYVVTDPSDNDMVKPKNGTLRYAVIQKEPLWIIFAHDMTIKLNQELIVQSHKTIDGRGAKVQITGGAGFMLQFVKNVIIHGIHIHDIIVEPGGIIRDSVDHFGQRGKSDGDAISIFGASNIWIDHVSMSNCEDGLIDAIQGSTAITISNNFFTKHDHVMLLGASDSYTNDTIMQVTIAFNHFGEGLVQRLPRLRYGFVHVVNNDYTHWLMYALGGSSQPTFLSQGNRFTASDKQFCKEVTKRELAPESVWKNWNWRSENDILLNGATFIQSGKPITQAGFKTPFIKAKPGAEVEKITRYAGALDCIVGKPC